MALQLPQQNAHEGLRIYIGRVVSVRLSLGSKLGDEVLLVGLAIMQIFDGFGGAAFYLRLLL